MSPAKIIVDTDPGVDDVLAILLLLASPEVQIEAITLNFGNTTLEKTYTNILKVYQLIQKHLDAYPEDARRYPNFVSAQREGGHRPIYAKGAEVPLKGSINLAEYFHGSDGLSNISDTNREYDLEESLWSPESNGKAPLKIVDTPAHQVILDILKEEPAGTVTILTLGPLTNISTAITADPITFSKVQRVVSMGGALDVPGNTSPSAEFNFFADPYAAQHVYDEAQRKLFPFFLVPLDITSRHLIPFERMIADIPLASPDTIDSQVNDIQRFLSVMLLRPRKVLRDLGLPDAMEMHDPLAAWFVIATSKASGGEEQTPDKIPAEIPYRTLKRKFVIERLGEYTKGMCVVDRRGTNEAIGITRAIEGIVLDNPSSGLVDLNLGVDVLLISPDPQLFVKIMMERVFWFSKL